MSSGRSRWLTSQGSPVCFQNVLAFQSTRFDSWRKTHEKKGGKEWIEGSLNPVDHNESIAILTNYSKATNPRALCVVGGPSAKRLYVNLNESV